MYKTLWLWSEEYNLYNLLHLESKIIQQTPNMLIRICCTLCSVKNDRSAGNCHRKCGQCTQISYLAAFTCDDSIVYSRGLVTTNFAWYHFNLCWKRNKDLVYSWQYSFLLIFHHAKGKWARTFLTRHHKSLWNYPCFVAYP